MKVPDYDHKRMCKGCKKYAPVLSETKLFAAGESVGGRAELLCENEEICDYLTKRALEDQMTPAMRSCIEMPTLDIQAGD